MSSQIEAFPDSQLLQCQLSGYIIRLGDDPTSLPYGEGLLGSVRHERKPQITSVGQPRYPGAMRPPIIFLRPYTLHQLSIK